jgi:hypothetical protein
MKMSVIYLADKDNFASIEMLPCELHRERFLREGFKYDVVSTATDEVALMYVLVKSAVLRVATISTSLLTGEFCYTT